MDKNNDQGANASKMSGTLSISMIFRAKENRGIIALPSSQSPQEIQAAPKPARSLVVYLEVFQPGSTVIGATLPGFRYPNPGRLTYRGLDNSAHGDANASEHSYNDDIEVEVAIHQLGNRLLVVILEDDAEDDGSDDADCNQAVFVIPPFVYRLVVALGKGPRGSFFRVIVIVDRAIVFDLLELDSSLKGLT